MRSGWIRYVDSAVDVRSDPWTTHPQHRLETAAGRGGRNRRGRRVQRRWPTMLGITALACGSGMVGAFLMTTLDDRAEVSGDAVTVIGASPAAIDSGIDGSTSGVADAVLPSVVSVDVGDVSGSGIVLAADGVILTNNHVVAGASDEDAIELGLFDGRELHADIVGRSPSYDLAVLRTDADDLRPAVFGDPTSVEVGDAVVAIGSPLGLDGTVTSGIISAVDRPVIAGPNSEQSFISALQTDAAINPGNSGGPLVNLRGHVVGVNSAIATLDPMRDVGNIGLGFAIPIDQALATAEQLIADGEASYPIIGAFLDHTYDGPGAQIAQGDDNPGVSPDGPAEQAGIEPGDVITHIDDRQVSDLGELVVVLRTEYEPGDQVTLVIERDGERHVITLTLDSAIG